MSTLKYLKKPLITICLVIFACVTHAEVEYLDLPSRTELLKRDYYVNDDYSMVITTEFKTKALTEASLKSLKKYSTSHSTSIEKLEIIEAYTLKPDGTKVQVPENNYQVNVNKGHDGKGPVFSDRTRITVVFPDLEVNDSIYLKSIRTQTEPMFPGEFDISNYFWRGTAYDDVQVTVNVPRRFNFKYEVREMKKQEEKKGKRKIFTLTYSNPKPIKSEREDFSVWSSEEEAGFVFSSFKSYSEIAQAYAKRAQPKAEPSARVKKLAKEIVGSEKDKLQQATRLYNWVAEEITYAGNCIGVGAVVPHDTDFILDNKMGDCKDQATLLEALLAAQGIESWQALVNSGGTYDLPEIPIVSSVNHVINYLPEWDKYLDATASTTPFDLVPAQLTGKPVIWVKQHKDGLRIPSSNPMDTHQILTADMEISPDGDLSGTISVQLQGYPAAYTRSTWRGVTEQQEKDWLETAFSSQNALGSGSMTKEDPKPLLATYSFDVKFNRPEYILSKGAGGFYPFAPLNTAAPVYGFTQYSKEPIDGHDVACGSGISEETLRFTLPESMKILAKPDDFKIKGHKLAFEATYALDGRVLEIKRKIVDHSPGPVCSAELMNSQREMLIKVNENLSSQVVYQY